MTAFEKIDNLVGMEHFKKMIEKIKYMHEKGLNKKIGTGIYVFGGKPSTDKTTAAKLFGELLYEIGLFKNGNIIIATRNDFVADFIGQSRVKTKDLLEKALDAVLYIDEADSLMKDENDFFGKEVMETIFLFMYENYNKICLILSFSDYREKFEKLDNLNPGLRSKISEFIAFEDHNE